MKRRTGSPTRSSPSRCCATATARRSIPPLPECLRALRTLGVAQLVRADGLGDERKVRMFHERVREVLVQAMDAGEWERP